MHDNPKAVEVGRVAPNFCLTDQAGNSWSLADKRGKVVLLLFYPANETLVCTKQLCSLRDNWAKYLDTKAEIVGVSSGDPEANRIFAEKYRLPLPILADADRTVTKQYAGHKIFPFKFYARVNGCRCPRDHSNPSADASRI